MRNIVLEIQYNGTNYNGWQIQTSPKTVTIQDVLQQTIKKITDETVRVTGAGRTDSGVHAICQLASFLTSANLSTEIIQRALNANLPYDIRILSAREEDISFNPRFDAKSKVYTYFISNSKVISPFFSRYTWNIPYELDIDEMTASAAFLIGKHDFSSFRGSGCGARNTNKTIFSIEIKKFDNIDFMTFSIKGDFIKISVEADSFLRHMVRNIIGTLFEIGRGRWKANNINDILLARSRRLAGQTAPARGLFLEKINY